MSQWTVQLSPSQIAFHQSYASVACGYWTSIERLPAARTLRAALAKPLTLNNDQLKCLANEDAHSTDMVVQLALFHELRYG